MDRNEALRALREAVLVSPDNVPLRQHLANTLLHSGRPKQAEKEYREALVHAPEDPALKLGLARAFCRQGEYSNALVIVEGLVQRPDVSAETRVLYARLLLGDGEVEAAVEQYRKAIDEDSSVEDEELAERLGTGVEDDRSEVVDGKIRAAWGDVASGADTVVERPAVMFEDVGGMEKAKDEIRMKIIHPLSHAELFRAYDKTVGGGILMYGPPGCGKTHLARATAGEIDAAFLAVGINDVLEMWIGNSERNLHAWFEMARSNQPCVLFFDEVDALAASRSDMQRSAGRQLINQFLAELDGLGSPNEGVLILAATNAPWHLDPAFRRPGRFDRILFVPPPDAPARSAILRIHCEGKPITDIDFDHLAKKTENFSGADLRAVVDLAVEKRLEEAMRSGTPEPLTTKDLAGAARSINPSTKEWFATARNYALYSNQGGLYDDILRYLRIR